MVHSIALCSEVLTSSLNQLILNIYSTLVVVLLRAPVLLVSRVETKRTYPFDKLKVYQVILELPHLTQSLIDVVEEY